MFQKNKKTTYLFVVLLKVGLVSIYAREKLTFSSAKIKLGYGACKCWPNKCNCANWQGGFTKDSNEKCKCGHKFSEHYEVESD
jgi:hypothetical protein